MDDLRVILLLTGAAVIAGIYVWTRLQQRPVKQKTKPGVARAANVGTDDGDIEKELERMEQLLADHDRDPEWNDAQAESAESAESGDQVQIISIIAEDNAPFVGDKLLKAFANNDLIYSSNGIYERRVHQPGGDAPVFGVANLVKPGTFPAIDVQDFTSPGVTLFLQLPCAIGALDAFDDFMNTAERLAVELAGELRDEKHQLLTHQALLQVRERIAEAQIRMHAAVS